MKNEKFCFSKGTGLIALVGVLLVGFVLLTQMTNQTTSLGSKAAPGPKHCYYATVDLSITSTPYYYSAATGCILDASDNYVGYKCNMDAATGALTGGSLKDTVSCPLPAAAARTSCFYGGQAMSATPVTIGKYTYSVDANQCVVESGKLLGLKCDTTTFKVVADKTTCPAPAARTACQYGGTSLPATIGTQAYAIDGNGCITADAATIGYKCDSTTGFAAKKDTACAAPAAAARTSCYWGTQALSATAVKIGTEYYSLEAGTGCVLKATSSTGTAYNNGYKCDASTNYKSVKDSTTCRL